MLGVVPFIHPYHARQDGYRDYWRFSQDGLKVLCNRFQEMSFLPFLWRFKKILERTAYILDRIFIKDSRNTTAGYIIFAKK